VFFLVKGSAAFVLKDSIEDIPYINIDEGIPFKNNLNRVLFWRNGYVG
jgi:hypothetical protein